MASKGGKNNDGGDKHDDRPQDDNKGKSKGTSQEDSAGTAARSNHSTRAARLRSGPLCCTLR